MKKTKTFIKTNQNIELLNKLKNNNFDKKILSNNKIVVYNIKKMIKKILLN